jgi:2-polyprenyl-3-methyl-5-hydroxy-6-metoxy-1,4-benzoquinol methylase
MYGVVAVASSVAIWSKDDSSEGRLGRYAPDAVGDEIETNRRQWDERTTIHVSSTFYDVEGFKAGRSSLRPLELSELGDVSSKRILHLQCHFGLDTLSLARLGAQVTGVDFSPEAIGFARNLADELRLDVRFVCSDIYDLPRNLRERFDIVFTSYGVLAWLPHLTAWARTIAEFLRSEGFFYIVEQHPLSNTLVEDEGKLVVADPYFNSGAVEVRADGTYAAPAATLKRDVSYQWQHSLSDVVTSICEAGLRIEFLHEFAFGEHRQLPSMEQGADGSWRLPNRDDVPFLFSLLARKV